MEQILQLFDLLTKDFSALELLKESTLTVSPAHLLYEPFKSSHQTVKRAPKAPHQNSFDILT
jgi:hypothetical protein